MLKFAIVCDFKMSELTAVPLSWWCSRSWWPPDRRHTGCVRRAWPRPWGSPQPANNLHQDTIVYCVYTMLTHCTQFSKIKTLLSHAHLGHNKGLIWATVYHLSNVKLWASNKIKTKTKLKEEKIWLRPNSFQINLKGSNEVKLVQSRSHG